LLNGICAGVKEKWDVLGCQLPITIVFQWKESILLDMLADPQRVIAGFASGRDWSLLREVMNAHYVREDEELSARCARGDECSLRSRKKSSLTGVRSSLREETNPHYVCDDCSLRSRRKAPRIIVYAPSLLSRLPLQSEGYSTKLPMTLKSA
jgi:hypothetical protein